MKEDELPKTEDKYDSLQDDSLSCLTDEERNLLTDYYTCEDRLSVAKKYNLSPDVLYVRIHRIRRRLADNLNNII